MSELQLAKAQEIASFQAEVAKLPQADIETLHHFCSGVYARTMILPAGYTVVGKKHRFPCLNILSAGRVLVKNVADDFGTVEHSAPAIFESPAGTKRAIVALSDAAWTTLHATQTTDLDALEAEFIMGDDE